MMGGEVVEIFAPGKALIVLPNGKQGPVRNADEHDVLLTFAKVIGVLGTYLQALDIYR
jgi:hypothetical protein